MHFIQQNASKHHSRTLSFNYLCDSHYWNFLLQFVDDLQPRRLGKLKCSMRRSLRLTISDESCEI